MTDKNFFYQIEPGMAFCLTGLERAISEYKERTEGQEPTSLLVQYFQEEEARRLVKELSFPLKVYAIPGMPFYQWGLVGDAGTVWSIV